MRLTRSMSASLNIEAFRSLRLRFALLPVSKCAAKAFLRLNFPLFVDLNRLAADLLVFIFGNVDPLSYETPAFRGRSS